MPEQVPTVGRSVHYALTEQDCRQIVSQRAGRVADVSQDGHHSVAIWYGNMPYPGDIRPMEIVAVNSNGSVTGQVKLDGNDVLWKPSAMYLSERLLPGQLGRWFWPPRV